MRICPDCHASVSDSANFCDNCGYSFQSSPPPVPAPAAPATPFHPQGPPAPAPGPAGSAPAGACSACGYQNVPGEMFCQNCGVQLAPIASAPPPPPRPLTGPRPAQPAPPPASAPAVCPSCRHPAAPSDAFCPNCGMLLSKAGPASEPPRPPSQPQRAAIATSDLPAIAPGFPFPPEPGSAPAAPPRTPELPHQPSTPPAQPAPAVSQPAPAVSQPAAFPPGRLVLRDSGAEIPLPAGHPELVIGRSDPVRGIYPEIDLTPHGGSTRGVSRRHARLHVINGRPQIEDLNSTNYTFINRQRLQPGQSYPLKDGDEIRVGLLALEYHPA